MAPWRVPRVSHFQGNDALHGFVRKAYGFPQGVGCVELPLPQARRLWHLIHYGTLVTVDAAPTIGGPRPS